MGRKKEVGPFIDRKATYEITIRRVRLSSLGGSIFHRWGHSMIIELSKALRCCRQDEGFCAGEVTFTQFIILDAVASRGTLDIAEL